MATLEMVEKLRERAAVSYDEAKTALDACGDDLLEALIWLERQGRVQPPSSGGSYSTAQEAPPASFHYEEKHGGFREGCRRFWAWICRLMHKGNTNCFEVWRGEARIIQIPITALVILTLLAFWVVLLLLIIGLFCGYKYRFAGPEMNDTPVNQVMDSAAQAADSIKKEVLNEDDFSGM